MPKLAERACAPGEDGVVLEQRERVEFRPVLPQISAALSDRPSEVIVPEEVEKGRAKEAVAISARERLADTIRGNEEVPGHRETGVT